MHPLLLICSHVKSRRTTLIKIRKQVGAPSVRQASRASTSTVDVAQQIVDLKENDIAGKWGVTATKGRLANDGVLVPRYVIPPNK